MTEWCNLGNIAYKLSLIINKLVENKKVENKLENKKGNLIKLSSFYGFDFDHTLVKPKNGRVHSNSIDDMEFCFDNIIDKFNILLKEGKHIFILSNQSGFYDSEDRQKIILGKFNKFLEILPTEISNNISIFISLKKDYCRKPNLGIFEILNNKLNIHIETSYNEKSIYVGDAAGRICNASGKKDFTNTDRLFALNAGLDFYTPEKYFLGGKKEKELYGVPRFITCKTFEEFEYGSYGIEDWAINDYDVFIVVGPPSTGKSYIANLIYSNLKKKSKIVLSGGIKTIEKELQKNYKVILDNTNTNMKRSMRYSIIQICNSLDKKTLCISINTTKDKCFFMNNYKSKTELNERKKDVVIHSYYKFSQTPLEKEGFTKLINTDIIMNFNKKNGENDEYINEYIDNYEYIDNEERLFKQYF